MGLRRLLIVVTAYVALWLVTAVVGTPQVEADVMSALIAANGNTPASEVTFEEATARSDLDDAYPCYDADAIALAPFVLLTRAFSMRRSMGRVTDPFMCGYSG